MNFTRTLTTLGLSVVCALAACSARPPITEAPAEPTPVVTLYERDRFIVSAQPSEADLATVAERGVRTVVCMRSDEEMAELGFDEKAAVEALGMSYVHIPMGRDHGYTPEQVDRLNALLEASDGPIYLHCGSGTRARQLWMASMIDRGLMTVDEAKLAARDLGESEPMLDQLLGRRVSYGLEAEPAPAEAGE